MSKKIQTFVNEKGVKVAVDHNPIEGQLRYVESERTAIDGAKWWCIFDNWLDSYVCGFRYETKRQCRAAIAKFLREGRYLPQKYLNGGEEKKSQKTKKYAIDVHCDLAKCYEIEAESREDAEEIVWKKILKILSQPNPYPIHALIAEGFETTDDAEVTCSGEENEDGEIEYF